MAHPQRTGAAPPRGGLIGALALATLGLGTALLVSVWALASPSYDPLGPLAATGREALSEYASWARKGPVDGAPDWNEASMAVHDGDPVQGARLIAQRGCGSCHTIPGVARAHGTVGPSLAGFRQRAYVAGILPNRPGDLVAWLTDPPAHAPRTAMPDSGLTEREAEHMAAYLYTLRGSGR